MPLIPLNRQFIEWRNKEEDELSDPDILSRLGMHDGAKGWDDLLKRRRVVILAEAGSGKSEELKGQARRLADDNKVAFYASVQDVGREGLGNAIAAVERPKLAAWLSSDQPAWFFIDSIDEAKLDGVRLERALRNIADAIHNAEGRAHIILSGRHTDWEFRRDLARLQEVLPVPPEQGTLAPPTADELIVRTLHHERTPEEAGPEAPLVAVLMSLDAERVRIFAEAKGAANLDALIAEIDVSNLWRFARRPLDLDWLVQFWKANRRLGSLAEMLATSLRERLQESDPVRAHRDPLDLDRALEALERIGAALVFGRTTTLCIPDGEIVLTGDNPGFDLADVLPDRGGTDRARLLNRPVFDPATFGRVRLHNDNEGVVRAYLAARWLHRLRQANLSRTGLFNLLFADAYGVRLVKPSLQEAAAWLSIWDPDVAREVIHREPYLLLTAGDPASLPSDLRASALTRVVERMVANDEHLPLLDYDSLKRFTRPDIAPVIRQLWPIHKQHRQARALLLRLIWLGELRECADLAAEAVSSPPDSRHDQVVAGRAFIATADDDKKAQYAAQIVRDCASRPPTVVWDAVETLFPSILGIDDLLAILGRVDVTDRDGGIGFQWQSPDLVSRIDAPADLERLLVGLLALIGPEPDDVRPARDDREEAFLAAIGSAAYRLLLRATPDTASVATIDAATRIGRHIRFNRGSPWDKVGDAGDELRKTSARRRSAFWRAAERMHGHRYLQGRPVQHPWELEILGWSSGLTLEDVDWLLADAPNRETEHERKLAVNAALYVWARSDRPEAVRERIQRTAASDPAMREAYDEWMRPRPPDPELVESERRLREIQERNAIARAEGDQSWRDFVSRLRADPDQLRRLNPATAQGIDNRLYHLWRLLTSAEHTNSRYAIDSVAAVEPMLGRELAAALRDGLIRYWRTWEPSRKSTLAPEERNRVRTLDVMGVAGVSLEAAGSPDWVNHLDADLARRATAYATLEINGFPPWMADLSERWPTEVAALLHEEVVAELGLSDARFAVLHDIGRADDCTLAVMVPSLLDELEHRPDLRVPMLSQLLDALERAPGAAERACLVAIAVPRFLSARDTQIASLYIAAVFSVDPAAATDALIAKLDDLSVADQTLLAQGVLPSIFGDRFPRDRRSPKLSFRNLERLVHLAFKVIRVEEDKDRPSGVVYSPDARDDAEGARNAAFKQLTEIPGRATFNALLGLAELPQFPISPQRLRALARERASKDSEAAPWPPGEAYAFEDKCESLPRTPIDLQRLLLARLSDLQHSLLHDDFAQGSTLGGLPDERAVQNWMADYLRRSQGRSYTIEREPHVVGEKEPDIRARSANDASVPIEIKVAESWTVEELEAALVVQLCGRYLRASGGRHGILLLIHQNARSRGWINPKNGRRPMDFAEVTEHLRLLAKTTAGADPDSPQPEVAVIDVSSCAAAKPSVRKPSAAKSRESSPHAVAPPSTSRTRRGRGRQQQRPIRISD